MDAKFQIHSPIEINGFVLLAEIGRGSTGCVRVARQISTETDYCVKIVPKQFLTSAEDKAFFDRECETLRSVIHPNVVQFIDLTDDEENYYLFMEYCRGTSLQAMINQSGQISERLIQIIFKQLMLALSYLHSNNVAHRDIKPDNIIINNMHQLKLVDFGLCTNNSDALRETFCGSPAYAAPECICRRPYDASSSDIWSAGVVLYAMATGQLPWRINNLNLMINQIVEGKYAIPSYINPQLQNLIKSMLNPDPAERPKADQILSSKYFNVITPVLKPRIVPKKGKIHSSSVDLTEKLRQNRRNSPSPLNCPTRTPNARFSLEKNSSNPIFVLNQVNGDDASGNGEDSDKIRNLTPQGSSKGKLEIAPPPAPITPRRPGSFHRVRFPKSIPSDKMFRHQPSPRASIAEKHSLGKTYPTPV